MSRLSDSAYRCSRGSDNQTRHESYIRHQFHLSFAPNGQTVPFAVLHGMMMRIIETPLLSGKHRFAATPPFYKKTDTGVLARIVRIRSLPNRPLKFVLRLRNTSPKMNTCSATEIIQDCHTESAIFSDLERRKASRSAHITHWWGFGLLIHNR